ncbi:type I secretion protein [Klebsiella pneumoniae]|uniref:Type I secretion protein n=1 Tax=Klebsiella pneumoniae TaxID=573 RepID=A0A377TUN1_KLEPN|nr:type I secretion protein [Klebsiella pneumoniae]
MLFIVSPWLSWIAPVATILMLLPGLLLQKKLAELANKISMKARYATPFGGKHSGPAGYKMMQAEVASATMEQLCGDYCGIGSSNPKSHSWAGELGHVDPEPVVCHRSGRWAPLVINGDITTGAMVAASMLSSRMVAPMTALCGVLARWQQVKVAKASLDNINGAAGRRGAG